VCIQNPPFLNKPPDQVVFPYEVKRPEGWGTSRGADKRKAEVGLYSSRARRKAVVSPASLDRPGSTMRQRTADDADVDTGLKGGHSPLRSGSIASRDLSLRKFGA